MPDDAVAAVVAPTGELDISNVDELRTEILRAAHDSDVVVADLSAVAYIDSSTINVLLIVTDDMRSRRGDLRVVAPTGGRARRILDISGVNSALSVYEALDDALAR
jgi:anti-anti-sigma factor